MRRTGIRAVSLIVVLQFCGGHLRVQEAQDPQDVKHSESAESDVARGACPPWAVPKYVAYCDDSSSATGTSASNLTTEGADRSINEVAIKGTLQVPLAECPFAKGHFANSTAAGPRSLRGSRFQKVLRVIMHAYVHQIDFFLAQMGPNHTDFWGTVFVNPRYENDTELDAFRERVPLVDCAAKQLESHSVSHRDYSYLCVGPFLRSFGESFPGSSELSPGWLKLLKGRNTAEVVGALVHQADFWFHSSFGRGWPLENSIWHMDFACPQVNDDGITLPPWGWRNEFKDGLEKRRQKIQSVLELDNLGTCFGSADLYYVSRAGWEMLGNITEIWQWNLKEDFKPRREALPWWEGKGDTRRWNSTDSGYNSNEVAVPITMDALQRKGLSTVEICWQDNKNGLGVESGRSESGLNQLDRDMCCATNSPRPYAGPWTISRNRCGHKMDMQNACSKEAYMQAWLSHDLG